VGYFDTSKQPTTVRDGAIGPSRALPCYQGKRPVCRFSLKSVTFVSRFSPSSQQHGSGAARVTGTVPSEHRTRPCRWDRNPCRM